MLILVCYDIADVAGEGRRRLTRVARRCSDYGIRVQYSVFELRVAKAQWVKVRSLLLAEIDPEQDSLRFYFVGDDDAGRTEHHGVRTPLALEDPLII
jgi:CRISPR-associated protein Cas2